MIRCHRRHLEQRCLQRGYTLEQVRGCIVSEDGDKITVDETHPSYPRAPAATTLQKVANFASSAVRHAAAGMPRASEDEVVRRFAICERCDHYDGRACRKCGCPVKRERQFFSKLSWAGESCPVGKWGPADTNK